jgi:putative ABC transport system ATP-binding protein
MMGISYISNKDIKEKAVSALEKVGLKDRMKHKPVEMSGGEQQRVSIARALVKNPRIVLADEPTGALDTKTGSEIMEILTNLNIESKITVLIVTHEPDIAKQTKRIISFRDGEIINDERNK